MGKGLLLDARVLEVMRGDQELFRFGGTEEFVLDVGRLGAREAAGMVGGRVERVSGWEGVS